MYAVQNIMKLITLEKEIHLETTKLIMCAEGEHSNAAEITEGSGRVICFVKPQGSHTTITFYVILFYTLCYLKAN